MLQLMKDDDIPSYDNDGCIDDESEQHTIRLHILYIDNNKNKFLPSQKGTFKLLK
jgi:hypothetical protein